MGDVVIQGPWASYRINKDKSNESLPVLAFRRHVVNVDVVIQGAWVLYRINKDKGDESLHVLAFRRHAVNVIFLKYSKEGRLSSSHLGIRNIPSDVSL